MAFISKCFIDLTKKTKIKGLTTTSWLALIILGFISWFFLVLYSIFVIIFLYCFFFTLEFFDEDIYKIFGSKFKIKSNKFYA
ncbi:hypothetical protein CINF_0616 [Candidatus Campylobacter infans]|uniref:Uncharacterized protein n=1 Tax=Candidatus Campylobacter infans TaxID=2561898 RepID=A0A7H9CIQ9_9BACT|nr:hypothetical protein [Candidatus Campylobacter infans]QLI05138.1 hypothetical protein CINF_0616 [Candidatus Campylobacter infans]